MDSVIISGADGFLGSYTADYFLKQGVRVTALDLYDEPKRLKPKDRLAYARCDITDSKEMFSLLDGGNYDTFIHFAWSGASGPDRMNYRLQMQNAFHAVEILKTARKLGCSRFLCAGSIMEYEAEAAVHAQGAKPGTGYLYGLGKYAAHCMCKMAAADTGIDLIWPVITNAYGVGEMSPRMLNTAIRKMINHEPLQFTSAVQNYDFIYVTDAAKAIYLIASKGHPFCEYIVGSGKARPLREFLTELRNELAPECELRFGDLPFTGTNLPLSVFDTAAVRQDCGFEPEVPFAEGTRMTIEWLRTMQRGDTGGASGI